MNLINNIFKIAIFSCLPILSYAEQCKITLDATPTTINIQQGKDAQGVVLTNYSDTDAIGLQVHIPDDSTISLDTITTTCNFILPANSRCLYSFAAGEKIETKFITITGFNVSNLMTIVANVVPNYS